MNPSLSIQRTHILITQSNSVTWILSDLKSTWCQELPATNIGDTSSVLRILVIIIVRHFYFFLISFNLSRHKIYSFFYPQPMLQELGKQNPNLMRLIQEHQADFLRLINEPVEGGGWVWQHLFYLRCWFLPISRLKLDIPYGDFVIISFSFLYISLFWIYLIRNIPGQLAGAMPQSVTVTPEEREAIERVSLLTFCLSWSISFSNRLRCLCYRFFFFCSSFSFCGQ